MGGKLDGWKAIARHLGRSERTVQSWERERQLPVHRVGSEVGQSVFAYTEELNAWLGHDAKPATTYGPALLVLPFEHYGIDASWQFVADGLAEELIGRLACTQLSSMRVLSWTTAKTLRQSPKRAQTLAQELGVRYLVEGNISSFGEQWRIEIRLVDAEADRVIFGDRFACKGPEVLLLQSRVAAAVAEHLALVLAGEFAEPMWTQEVEPAAFLCHLAGLRGFADGSSESLAQALSRFEEALAIDPGFMPAVAMRGITLVQMDNYHVRRDPEILKQARQLAADCLQRAPAMASTAFLDAAIASMYDFDWQRAERRLTSALKAVPASVALRGRLANTLSIQRQHERAAEVFAPVHHLDQSIDVILNDARNRLWRRDYQGADVGFNRMIEQIPQHLFAHVMRVMGAVYRRDAALARQYIAAQPESVRQQFHDLNLGCLAVLEGNAEVARIHRNAIENSARAGEGHWYHATMIDSLAGDANAAAASLAEAVGRREISCTVAAVDPSLDSVRDAPAVRKLIASMGLPI